MQRRGLLRTLVASGEPLVLLSAPAGAGKTTTLRQWTEVDGRPCVWLQLDEADTDPVVLLIYLVRGLSTVAPVDPTVEASLMVAVPPVRERVLPLLAGALAQAPPFVIVLDDAHLLGTSPAWDVVTFLLRNLPQGAQLAIGTRADPPLMLARMRAAGELAELRGPDLALDRVETAELLSLEGCALDAQTVDALYTATEGWAAGLHLACLAADGCPSAELLSHVRGDARGIATYLTSEVLDGEPADLQAFLLDTSVLTELTPALCQLATGRDDAGDLLARAAAAELFLVPLGDDTNHYRYHSMFAEMLEAELERRHPGRPAELHARIADRYLELGTPDLAIHHLLEAGDTRRAGDVVASSWLTPWSRGQTETVRRWLESFTDQQVLENPALVLTAGWVYTALDAGRLGERWARAACDARMGADPAPDGAASLRSSQALLRATVAPDGVRRMREDAELAVELETSPNSSWYADAHVSLGVARWLTGSAQRALRPLALGARSGSVNNASAELAALGYLALVACEEGEWEAAREYETRASERLAELGFGTSRRCLPMLLARVRVLAHDRSKKAEEAAAEVDHLLRHMVPHRWMELLAQVVLGEAALERADQQAADAHAAAAVALLKRYPDAGILRGRVERLYGAVVHLRGAVPLSPAERRVLELLPTHLTEPQIAEQLFISRNTVKSHLRSLYRKLAVTSRLEAVERGRATGLLPPD